MIGDAIAFYPVIRGLLFIVLLLLVGTQTAAWIVRRRFGDEAGEPAHHLQHKITDLAGRLAIALLALTLARAGAQLWSLKDPTDSLSWDFAKVVLLDGTWGYSWILQTVAAFSLCAITSSPSRRATRFRPFVPFLILLVLWAQTGMGHAASGFWNGPLGRGLQLAHLVGGGVWLGTLGVLAVAVFPALDHAEGHPLLGGVLQDFSVAARSGAAMVVLAGLLITLKYAGSVSAFLAAAWGRLLMLKFAGLGGVAGLGWYNWRVVTPGIARGDPDGAARLRRAVRAELALGLVMLAITAFLVATQLPREQ
jgi:putative copper export protein